MKVRVARIGKPHGIRGEVTVQVLTDAPEERFVRGTAFDVDPASHGVLTVRSARWNKDILILGFEEVPDRNRAEELRGATLSIETDELDDEGEEGWYEHELVGLEARVDGRAVGTVTALQVMPAQDLLVVDTPSGEVLVPFVEEIVPEVDVEGGFVVVVPPPGLFELNREAEDAGDDRDHNKGDDAQGSSAGRDS
ncbi:ribosome maturation factor RimM [Sinomonas sp. ASV322]|uniref:ribosome maturation factor RimM n=1 Tax=Sinomonas sp. ASV322 TaxID=3041920 RepID=UPI0027DB3F5E|nr:ribosome maturation factor RimM [Sinomonas sp. ASV322]MDQ4502263.1 ribosome maturation factor RimM [Sinomonas sp. ASV322]